MSFELVHLNDGVSNEDVQVEIRRRQLVPATREQLRAFIEEVKLQDAPDALAVVALGTVLVGEDGREYVSAAEWTEFGFREVECAFGPGWFPNYRFLAVPSGVQHSLLQFAAASQG